MTHNSARTSTAPTPRERGVSLLEVLIALAVLSIGLAGLAIMHLNAQKYVHSAYERSLVSSIALDLEERLWLEVAEMAENDSLTTIGCPDLTSESKPLISDFIAQWSTDRDPNNPDDPYPVRIKDLAVSVEGFSYTELQEDSSDPNNPPVLGTVSLSKVDEGKPVYATVDLRFTWGAEGTVRFELGETARQTFDYTARIYCSSDYPGS